MSPAQLPPPFGANGLDAGGNCPRLLDGIPSVWQPLLLANIDPYPPIPLVLIDVLVVAGIRQVPFAAGTGHVAFVLPFGTNVIAGVLVTVMLLYPVYAARAAYSAPP